TQHYLNLINGFLMYGRQHSSTVRVRARDQERWWPGCRLREVRIVSGRYGAVEMSMPRRRLGTAEARPLSRTQSHHRGAPAGRPLGAGPMKRLVFPCALLAIVAASVAPSAGAAPMFARQYGFTCTVCHLAFPALNEFGEQFAANNFRLP